MTLGNSRENFFATLCQGCYFLTEHWGGQWTKRAVFAKLELQYIE